MSKVISQSNTCSHPNLMGMAGHCVHCGADVTPHTASTSRPDLLDMAYINSLPQPLFVREFGSQSWWPIHDIDVETGLYRIDVCGMLDVCQIGGAAQFRDADGGVHDSADFYVDADRTHVSDEQEVAK